MACRFTFFREPSNSFLNKLLDNQDRESLLPNHAAAGFTDPIKGNASGPNPPPPPTGFSERTVRVYLGEGRETYEAACGALLSWRMHEESTWSRIVLSRKKRTDLKVNMVTVAKACCGLVWSINPCVVLYERKHTKVMSDDSASPPPRSSTVHQQCWDQHQATQAKRLWAGSSPKTAPKWAAFPPCGGTPGRTGTQSAVAYTTLKGHLIQGEERMRVAHFGGPQGDGPVWFEVYSVSRGSGLVGGLLFPLLRPMQASFFREQADTVRRIV
ncbi:unnamed protein product, partial [Discosporangium mesarthrocarpum]